jgi:hypothetical protein
MPVLAISAIAIANDIGRRSLPTASLRQLSGNAFRRGGCGDPRPRDPTPMVPQNQEAIQQPEGKRRHDEQVDRGDAVSTVARKDLQPREGPPFLRAMYFATLV